MKMRKSKIKNTIDKLLRWNIKKFIIYSHIETSLFFNLLSFMNILYKIFF